MSSAVSLIWYQTQTIWFNKCLSNICLIILAVSVSHSLQVWGSSHEGGEMFQEKPLKSWKSHWEVATPLRRHLTYLSTICKRRNGTTVSMLLQIVLSVQICSFVTGQWSNPSQMSYICFICYWMTIVLKQVRLINSLKQTITISQHLLLLRSVEMSKC